MIEEVLMSGKHQKNKKLIFHVSFQNILDYKSIYMTF